MNCGIRADKVTREGKVQVLGKDKYSTQRTGEVKTESLMEVERIMEVAIGNIRLLYTFSLHLFLQGFYQHLVLLGSTCMALPETFHWVMTQGSLMRASEKACPTGQY